MTLNVRSLVVGFALAVLCFLGMAQQSPAGMKEEFPGRLPAVHPRDWVVIDGLAPYVVPAGKRLVVSAFGSNSASIGINVTSSLSIDGRVEVRTFNAYVGSNYSFPSNVSVQALAIGLSAGPGQTITMTTTSGADLARAWGYLVDE